MTARLPASTAVATSVLAGGAAFFTLLSWDGLSDAARDYLVPLFVVCVLVAASGLVLRAAGAPRWAVPPLQLLLVATYVHQLLAAGAGWIPSGTSLRAIGDVVDQGLSAANRYPAPVPATEAAFADLMVLPGAAVVLVVDVLAGTLRRPALAGPVLLAAFTVPVALLGGVSWLTFSLAALSFLLLLSAEQAARLSSWGASDGPVRLADDQPHRVRWSSTFPAALRGSVLAIGAAVLVPAVLPAADGLVGGAGQGAGDGEIRLDNPIADMRRDLVRGPDRPVLRVRTNDPNPGYVRMAVLDTFDGTTWRPARRSIPPTNRATGALPPAPGLAPTTQRSDYRWTFQVADQLRSRWLPLPYPVSFVDARGDWRYDDATLDVLSADDRLTAAGLRYTAVGMEVQPTADQLATAGTAPAAVVERNTALPDTIPVSLGQLALRVTSGAANKFESAVLLQDWFRRDGGFRYSLTRRSSTGSGTGDLLRFLGTGPDSRVGYCEQFSAAMAVLARTLGIPSRVAVGFLQPQRVGRAYVFSTNDLHSWPELYFEGTGWVRFEPTPAVRTGGAPAYTRGSLSAGPQPLPSAPAATSRPGRPAPAAPRPGPAPAAGSPSGSAAGGWAVGAGVVGAVSLVLLALAGPRLVRSLVRRRRWSAAGDGDAVEAAWAELRDTAVDLGVAWHDEETLRRGARALLPALGVDAQAGQRAEPVTALERLVLLVERSRYSARGVVDAGPLARTLCETVAAAMGQTAGAPARRRARWWPASLWSRSPARSDDRLFRSRRSGRVGAASAPRSAP